MALPVCTHCHQSTLYVRKCSLLVLWPCCIATVSAKTPLWGLPVPAGSRAGGNVKTGSASAEESPDIMGDLTNRNRKAGDDGTTVRDGDGIPPPNTPPSQKHTHRQDGFPASVGENGLRCLADSHVTLP
jgi:hypothetical protein